MKKISLSNGMKNVARISSGTIAGQIISFFSLPIIARIYGAEVCGIWALFNSIATIINSFSDLGLTNAIMIEEDEEASLRLYTVLSTIVMGISIIAGFVAIIYYSILPSNMGLNNLFIGMLIAILVFTHQQTQICYTWLNKKGKYEILMKNPVINNSIIGIVAIGLGLLGIKNYGYYIATILGQTITLLHMKRFLPKKMFSLKVLDYRKVFSNKKEFIKYQLPTNMISQLKNQLPVFLMETFFGTKMLGYYSVSVRVLNIPITLLARALGRVFFQTISDMKRNGEEIGGFAYRNIVKAMKFAIVPMVFLVAMGDIFILILYGREYEIAGTMLQIVSFKNFFTFLMMSSQGITITINKQKYAMISCIMQSIGYIIGLGGGKLLFDDVYIGLLLMSIMFIIVQVVYFCSLFKAMEVSWKKYLKDVIFSLLIILAGAVIVRLILNLVLRLFEISI